jgi:hypothetical protein
MGAERQFPVDQRLLPLLRLLGSTGSDRASLAFFIVLISEGFVSDEFFLKFYYFTKVFRYLFKINEEYS